MAGGQRERVVAFASPRLPPFTGEDPGRPGCGRGCGPDRRGRLRTLARPHAQGRDRGAGHPQPPLGLAGGPVPGRPLGLAGTNPCRAARLRQPRRIARDSMTVEEVRAAIAAAATIYPAAALALRLAGVAGLRRAELAGLLWEDVPVKPDRGQQRRLQVGADGSSPLVNAPTKTTAGCRGERPQSRRLDGLHGARRASRAVRRGRGGCRPGSRCTEVRRGR